MSENNTEPMPLKTKETEKSNKGSKTVKVEADKKTSKSGESKKVSTKDSNEKDKKDTKSKVTKDKENTKKEEKETKESKSNRGSEKVSKESSKPKDGLNDDTRTSGCSFNTHNTRTWIKSYYNRPAYVVTYEKKEDPDDKNSKKITAQKGIGIVKGTFCCLTGINEVLMNFVINLAGKRAKKDPKTELIKITEENMMDAVRLDKTLNEALGHYLHSYDPSSVYQKELGINKTEFKTFYETKCMNGNSSLTLDTGATNFMMFLVKKVDTLLCECAFNMALCYGKTQVVDRCILCSLRVVFPVGDLQKSMMLKADNISKRIKKTANKKASDSSKSEEDKNTKKSSKKNKDDNEDHSDNEEDENEEEDDNEDDDQEEDDNEEDDDDDNESDDE